MKIEIKSKNEEILYSCTDIGEGSKRYFKMQEYDYITLAFSVENPIYFKLGDGIDNELGLFELVDLYTPTYNTETGGYDYNLRLDAHYWKWKNKVFKYTPELFGQEDSWSLTASLSVHLNVFLKNLKAWGFKFRETDYTYEIQPGYGETSKALTYSNTNLIDALTMMAEAWGCEWWVTDNVIHFGRAEYGTETTFEQNVNVENMSRSESETKYATRIIAFGGESNIPAKYRKDLIFTNDGNGSEVMDDFRKLSYEYFAPESIISPEKKTLTANAEDDDIGDKTRPLFFSFRLPLEEKLELGKSYEIDLTSVVLKADITGGEFTGTQKVDIVLATSASLFDTIASLEFEAVGASFTKNLTTISFKVEETYNGEMPNNLYISVNTSENVTDVNGRISGNASCKGQFTLVNSARSANTSITVLTGENEGQTYQGVFNPDFFTGDSANVIKLTDGTLGKGEQYQVNNLVRSLMPDNYFTAPKTEATIDGVVSKRLMLPEDTPYIDAVEGLDMSQIVEKIITVDDIFPKRIGTISEVNTVDRDIQDDGEVTGTFKAYQYKDSGLVFDKKYVIKDDTLKITFQSGLLSGLTFEVQFEPEDSEKQTWEIVRNENYGRPLPDNIAYPQAGDKYILTGFDVEFVSDVYVPEAEQELKEYAIKAAEESYNRSFTYTVTMKPDYMWNGGEPKSFDLGDKIKLINKAYFEGSRSGRILGYEYPLDKPYDNPVYTVGDSPAYSRIGALEKKVETLQYGGKTYTGSGTSTGGGTSVYVIGSNDKTAWTNRNVLSSLRSKKEFISKTSEDSTSFLIRFLAGAEFGRFASGVAGGKISPDGAAELLTLLLRGALTIGDYQAKKSGAKIDEEGVADLLSILVRSAIESDNFSTGALGTGFCLKKDENGDSYLEIDRLLVRKVATFIELHIQQIKHVGGQIILTPASMSCVKVEDKGDFYRCYFENTDGERTIEQEFVVGDLARAQTFNVKEGVNENVTNTYYWRAVVGVGDNYIDLSKTDCDAGSTEPTVGDDIVQLGNKSDATRQAAIILSAYGNDAPYFKLYRGINSYSLEGKEFVSFSRSEVMIIADAIKFSSGESVKDYIDNAVGEVNTKVDDAISDLSENISFVNQLSKDLEAVKNQIDGAIETWFYEPVPTLSNEPAANWTTNEDKNVHLGDLYYDGNGKAYRFQVSGSKYTWQVITDSDITKALADAKKAQDTADGKRRVFVTTPSNASVYDIGDLWVNATYGSYKNDLLRCKTAKQANAQFSIEHWELASKYTDDTKANQAQAAADAAKQAADSAQQTANNAVQSAATANALLSDIANDNKLTAQEKQETKKEWDIIVSEKPKNDASADKYGVSRTAYDTAYNTLSAYITPLLSSLSTTSNISGATFRSKFKDYYDARTDLLNAISAKAKSLADAAQQTANAAQEKANQAIKDAANAKAAADNAQSDADEAKSRLDSWASDGSISPTEKQSLKEEIARIDADKTQIANGYTKYSLGTPTSYNNAHTAYRAVLITLTASSPETIAIPSDFATKQTTYYTQRTTALTAISNAARDYAQGIANDLSSYKKTVSSQFEQTNNSITAAVTSSKEYTDSAVSGIQIGGRNLFRNTKYGGDWHGNNWGTGKYSVSKEQVSENVGGIPLDEVTVFLKTQAGTGDIKMASTSYSNIPYAELENKNVTISFYAKCQENIKTSVSILIQNKYNGIISSKTWWISELSDNWVKYQYTFPIDKTTNKEGIVVFFTLSDSFLNKKIYFCLLKGEIGNKATDWSPAPEDAENALTEYKKEVTAQFSVLEGEISSKVSSTEITTIKQEIINTAASDATKKANDAKTSAISTASADATSKANKAKQDAISTAATDAANKANKAKNDAITTAGQNADKKYATITTVSSMQTSITQLSSSLSLKAEKSEVTAVQSSLNQTNNNLSSLTTRVSEAEVKLQPDNIWIGISSKVKTTAKTANIVPDSCFDDANYSMLYNGGSRVSAATANNNCPTNYCVKSSQRDVIGKVVFNVSEGEKYYISAYINASQCNYPVSVGLGLIKSNDSATSSWLWSKSVAAKTAGWQKVEGYITIPSGYSRAIIHACHIESTSNFGAAYVTKLYCYKVDESVNQNYALLTSNEKRLTTFNNVANQRNTLYKTSGLKKGDIVTISFEYEARNLIWNATENSYFMVQFDDKFGWTAYSIPNLKSNGTGKIITPPLTLGGSDTNIKDSNIEMVFYYISSVLQDNKPIGYFRVWNLKVEKGERATPWSAAPSDYSTTEEIKTGITVKENAISIFGKDVSLQGKITFSSLNSSLQSTINNKADSGDVTSDINSSKEDMAKKLGYASYADMVSAATAGNTIIEGGHIRTSLIEADALVVKTLNATNADGISTLVDKDGMNISKSNNSLLNIYFGNFGPVNYGVINMYSYDKKNDRRSEAIGITPSGIELYTYDGSGAEILRSETRLSFGELKILDESQTGIHIHKTGITLTYSKNKDELGLPVHYVKCIYSAYISSSGSVIDKMGTNIPNSSGNPITFSVSKYATGRYRVKHNIGNTLYHVQITALSNGNLTVALIENIYSTYFEYSTTSYNNGWPLMDAKVFIAVYYESPKLGTF